VALGSKNAKGATTPENVISGAWTPFTKRDVRRMPDNMQLSYYRYWPTSITTYTNLIAFRDGQCNAWAALWYATLKVQGIDLKTDKPVFRPTLDREYLNRETPGIGFGALDAVYGFLVKEWSFNGTGPGGAGTSNVPNWPYVSYFKGEKPDFNANPQQNDPNRDNGYRFLPGS
jgi:hypothetical protein